MSTLTLMNRAAEIRDWMKEIRRDFHQHPELSTEERRTREKIKIT